MKNLSPAAYVVKVFGSYRATAVALNRDVASIYRWVHPRQKSRRAGIIPAKCLRQIYEIAKQKKLDITLLDLVYGRSVNGGSK